MNPRPALAAYPEANVDVEEKGVRMNPSPPRFLSGLARASQESERRAAPDISVYGLR